MQCAVNVMCSVQCATPVWSVQCAVCRVQWTVYSVQCAVFLGYDMSCAECSAQFVVCSVHWRAVRIAAAFCPFPNNCLNLNKTEQIKPIDRIPPPPPPLTLSPTPPVLCLSTRDALQSSGQERVTPLNNGREEHRKLLDI